jgi:pimeloyl-ACP methyl ester carboxylesterase
VVIYMHGNASARVEALPQLSFLLSLGVDVFCFDFAGSGQSDGDYVSLGFYEREDLSRVVQHLRMTKTQICLWGRSMGASTALMYASRDPTISCMIVDSSFSSLVRVAEELVEKVREQGIGVPGIVTSVALRMIEYTVLRKAGFNIKDIAPVDHVGKCLVPALIVAGQHDDFIQKEHSESICEKYAGDTNLLIVQGGHNDPRPKIMLEAATHFLRKRMNLPTEWELSVPAKTDLSHPPWFHKKHFKILRAVARTHDDTTGEEAQSVEIVEAAATTRHPSSETGFDAEQMGMTKERQDGIQSSIFRMLGKDIDESKTQSR